MQELVRLGCVDVWSAVRGACVQHLQGLLERVSLAQLEDLYSSITAVSSVFAENRRRESDKEKSSQHRPS